MMRAGAGGELIAYANLSSFKLNDKGDSRDLCDVEVVYYKDTKSLCYQPHPEIVNEAHECRKHFLMLVDKLMTGGL